jgi:hypothetical protein
MCCVGGWTAAKRSEEAVGDEATDAMVLAHKLMVVLVWLVLTVAGGVAAGSLGGALSKDFSVAGRAARVNARISREFGSGGVPRSGLTEQARSAGRFVPSPSG